MTGEMIDGKYHVSDLLGEGGMGRVYKARHRDLDIDVAIKVIIPDQNADQSLLRKRFDQEAKAMARLNHSNIIDVKDYSAEKMYIVMEYLQGETLDEKVKREGALPVPEALSIFKQILEALDYAHNRHVIHRDIKPGNIFITKENLAKVMDFGLAAVRGTSGLTRTMIIAGTPTYEAPEQKRGLGFADHRSDIYSVGVALYEILVGTLPTAEDVDSEVRKAIEEGRIPPLDKIRPELPRDLVRVVMKSVQEEPAKRFQSAAEMLAALRAITPQSGPKQEAQPAFVPSWAKYLMYGAGVAGVMYLLASTALVQKWISPAPMLSVTSTPPASEVYLAGQLLGLTPLEQREVDTTGRVDLRISKNGFSSWDTNLVLDRGTTVSIFKRLHQNQGPPLTTGESKEPAVMGKQNSTPEQALALLSLKVIPNGRVLVDGVVREGSAKIRAGQHTVRFEHPTLGAKETTVRLDAGESRSMECYFEGVVNIVVVNEQNESRPSFVWIDGRIMGNETPWQGTLSAGSHIIGVKKAGYEVVGGDQTIQIDPSLGQRNTIPLRFVLKKI